MLHNALCHSPRCGISDIRWQIKLLDDISQEYNIPTRFSGVGPALSGKWPGALIEKHGVPH